MTQTTLKTKLGILRRQAVIHARRPRLGVHVWLPGNSYSDLIYRQFRDAYTPQPMTMLEELDAFTRLPSAKRLLWIHSEASYSWGRGGKELEDAHSRYLSSLDRWSRKKGRLIWTIHDDGLHLNDPDSSRIQQIRDKLREMADYVHVHSEAAKQLTASRFDIDPTRFIVVPHPSYASLYGNAAKRLVHTAHVEAGRQRHLLCFGHVKSYKDYDGLAAALGQLGSGSFAQLTIAGHSGGGVVLPEESYRRNVRLDLQLRFIPDAEVPKLFTDADFLVLPYTETLTSGVAALSMGFGVPVIAPDMGGMREAIPVENWPLTYAVDDPDGLANALRRARDMPTTEYEVLAEQCRAFGDSIHPDRVSAELVLVLRERRILPPH